MIVSNAVRDYLSPIRPGPDSRLAEMEEHGARDEQSAGAWAFNQRLLSHDEMTSTIAPVGDGVSIGLQP